MQICGIICEFNPFHNGHKYLIDEAKKLTQSKILCLMSGDFVQRGTPAIQEKYARAKAAITCGADLVLELPTVFACSNAENFAFGAVKILKSIGVNELAFGVEESNLETLEKIAQIKLENSLNFQNAFKNEIENGLSYNTALKRAIAKEFGDEKILEILAKPNNILAIEYLTAIKKLNAKIKPIAILRTDNGYNSDISKDRFLSASGIREKLKNNEDVSAFVPYKLNKDEIFDAQANDRFEALILSNLRQLKPEILETFYDYSEGIEYRIKEFANAYSSLDEIVENVSTPRYRKPRVQKLLLYPSLLVTKKIASLAKTTKPFAKLLAISKTNKQILAEINKSKINLVVTNKDYENLNKAQKQIIEIDLAASNLYNLAMKKQNNNDKKTGALFL